MTSPELERASQQFERPRKLQRISQACDLCHRRSIRCRPSSENQAQCQNCYDFAVECTYNRPTKRKKHPQAPNVPVQDQQQTLATSSSSATASTTPVNSTLQTSASLQHLPIIGDDLSIPHHAGANIAVTHDDSDSTPSSWPLPMQQQPTPSAHSLPSSTHQHVPVNLSHVSATGYDVPIQDVASYYTPTTQTEELSVAWRAFALSSETTICELLTVYMDIIYPVYPLFHEARLEARIRNKEFVQDRGFFAAVMGACALVSARIADHAIPPNYVVRLSKPIITTDIFYSAANDAISKDAIKNKGIDYMRACTLLALTCVQRNHLAGMQQYLGIFFTLVAVQRFYDEKFWAPGLSDVDLEISRRVYWCTYSLDVAASAIWNCFLRSQELHTNVRYPGEIVGTKEHTLLKNSKDPHAHHLPQWVLGWQFVIDLHRVLEHIVSKLRATQFKHSDRRSVDHLVFGDNFNDANVMNTLMQMFYNLPPILKETPQMTGNTHMDVYGYQAANIQATLQLIRIVLLMIDEGGGNERKCEVLGEVLNVFQLIPMDYLRTIGTPLCFHLGLVAQLIDTVKQQPMTNSMFVRVRAALSTMAGLLEKLGQGTGRFMEASNSMRRQVADLNAMLQQPSRRASQDALGMGRASNIGVVPTNAPSGGVMRSTGGDGNNGMTGNLRTPQGIPLSNAGLNLSGAPSSHVSVMGGTSGYNGGPPMMSDPRLADLSFPAELTGDWTLPVLYEHIDMSSAFHHDTHGQGHGHGHPHGH